MLLGPFLRLFSKAISSRTQRQADNEELTFVDITEDVYQVDG